MVIIGCNFARGESVSIYFTLPAQRSFLYDSQRVVIIICLWGGWVGGRRHPKFLVDLQGAAAGRCNHVRVVLAYYVTRNETL